MSVLKCIINYFKSHIIILILMICVIIFVVISSLIPPQIMKYIVDDIIPENNINKIVLFSLLCLSSYLFISLLDFLKQLLLIIIGQGIVKNIRNEMLYKIGLFQYNVFSSYNSGQLESYFSNDVDTINTLITSGVVSILIDLLKVIGIIISIFIFNINFGFIILAIMPLIIFISVFFKKRMLKSQVKSRKIEANVNDYLLECVDNFLTIKSFRIHDKINKNYNSILNNHFNAKQKSNFYDSIFSPIMHLVKNLVIASIVVLSAYNGSFFGLTSGTLVACIDLITNIFVPIESLGMEIQTVQKSRAGIKRINEFFGFKEDEKKTEILETDFDFNNLLLEFKNVYFTYDEKNFVIKNFNLKICNNDKYIFTGKSGTGKSTIFKLAYGIIKPTRGRVTINGIDTYLLPNNIKEKLFSIVYQDCFFSGGTIKEEITLFDNSISDEKVIYVLHHVGLTRIDNINIKLNKSDYSTGELSLFNIARSLVRDSKILFLDEMNSKIDNITERTIIKIINEIATDKIIISINHYGLRIKESKEIKLI